MRLRKSYSLDDLRNEVIKCQRILYKFRALGVDPKLEEAAIHLYRARLLLEKCID